MLSLSLVDSRIFFVSEMKFPYKKIFHTQKKCGENQKMWKIPIKEIVGF